MQGKSEGLNYSIEFMRIAGVILITFTHMRHDFTEGIPFFIFETVPKYGTLLLSLISGYLFFNSRDSSNLLRKKVISLLVPYLIANLAVLVPVVIFNALGYNFLNRLDYNYTIITEGLFALHSPPINPPTYFIRDLFVIFCFIELLKKNFWSLLFILPLLFFGQVLLRWDIAYLFICGFIINKYALTSINKLALNGAGLLLLAASFLFYSEYEIYKYIIALLVFINIIDLRFKPIKPGAYTYLLHLYHCPIMIFIFPLVHMLYPLPYFEVFVQFTSALLLSYILYLFIKRFNLRIIAGNRY